MEEKNIPEKGIMQGESLIETVNEEITSDETPASSSPARKKKKNRRRLYDHVILSFFLLFIIGQALSGIAGELLEKPLGKFLESTGHGTYRTGAGAIAGSLLCLLFFKLKFRRDGYKGQLVKENFIPGLRCLVVPIVLCTFLNMGDALTNGFSDVLIAFLCGLTPAVTEEVSVRGPALSNIMRKAENEKDVLLAFWLPAVVFGAAHAVNLLAGASLTATFAQVVYATGIGLVFGAAVLRTGSLWPSIIAHFFTDFSAFLGKTVYESQGVLNQELGPVELCILLGIGALFIAVGIFLMRKSKRADILALWARKWNKPAAPADAE